MQDSWLNIDTLTTLINILQISLPQHIFLWILNQNTPQRREEHAKKVIKTDSKGNLYILLNRGISNLINENPSVEDANNENIF